MKLYYYLALILFDLIYICFAFCCTKSCSSSLKDNAIPSISKAQLSSSQSFFLSAVNITPKIILRPLPKLYVYDHCPFCVRVRLALGLKSIKHELQFLANDDVDTPKALVGRKVVPIFEFQKKEIIMPESMDIIKLIDSDPEFGPINSIKPFSGRKDIAEWQSKYADLGRLSQRPRYMMTLLPEFSTSDSKIAFIRNHPISGFEKDKWLELSEEERFKVYQEGFELSLERMEDMNKALEELQLLISGETYVNEDGLSFDDIDLWSRLRSWTLVKGLRFPEKVLNYMDNLSKMGDISLYFSIAC